MNDPSRYSKAALLLLLLLLVVGCGGSTTSVLAEEERKDAAPTRRNPRPVDAGAPLPRETGALAPVCPGVHGRVGPVAVEIPPPLLISGGGGWYGAFYLDALFAGGPFGGGVSVMVSEVALGGHVFIHGPEPEPTLQFCVESIANIDPARTVVTAKLGAFSEIGTCPGTPIAGELVGCFQPFPFVSGASDAGAGFESCDPGDLTLTGTLEGSAVAISENVVSYQKSYDDLRSVFLDRTGALVFMADRTGHPTPLARLVVPNSRGETLCVGDAVAIPDAAGERFSLRLGSLSRLQNRCRDVPAPGTIDICL
jgi:hypothetical protein